MGDFTGYGFVAGTTSGFRSFRVDRLGRLTGVHHREVWRPGENVAACETMDPFAGIMRTIRPSISIWSGDFLPPSANPTAGQAKPVPEHDPATCQCGFYAYYHPDHNQYDTEYGGVPLVQGVVEGYGKTVIGSKGFRAQKARIVGLVAPQPAKVPELPKVTVDWRHQVALSSIAGFLAYVVAAVAGAVVAPEASILHVILVLLVATLAGASLPLAWTGFDVWRARNVRVTPDGTIVPPCDWLFVPDTRRVIKAISDLYKHARDQAEATSGRIDFDQVRRNYPDIPIYDSIDQLLAAHPLDKTQPAINLTPDTDPQFWDRPAE